MKRFVRPCVVAPILALVGTGCSAEEDASTGPARQPHTHSVSRAPVELPKLPTGPLPVVDARGSEPKPIGVLGYRPDKGDTSEKSKPPGPWWPDKPSKYPAPIPPDASTDDGGYTPEPEPVDAGTPEPEPVDAGTPEPEPVDAGTPEPEPEPVDAGTLVPDGGDEPVEPADGGVDGGGQISPAPQDRTVALRALVLSANGEEPSFGALTKFLDRLGTPYEVVIAAEDAFDVSTLTDSEGNGRFAAVFLATGSLGFWDSEAGVWRSALTADQWTMLDSYESEFGVREVQYYAYPHPGIGLQPVGWGYDTSASPLPADLSPVGEQVFFYVNPQEPIPVTGAWVYPAEVIDTAVTQVLVSGEYGEALTVLHQFPDGREAIINTMDNNYFLVHSLAYHYGLVNWAFRGVFPGERRVYLSEQVDDLFIDNDVWGSAETYRITGAELTNVAMWQGDVTQSLPAGSDFRLAMAFNGMGSEPGEYADATLVEAAADIGDTFYWINHTWDHTNLDDATYDDCYFQSSRNIEQALLLGLPNFTADNMVTPDISGLANADCLLGLWDTGVQFVVGNTSIPWMTPSGANVGMYDPYFPETLIVPRHPTNLFYNVTSPENWVGEYNEIYSAHFGRDLTYEEILDVESSIALQYLLSYDNNPLMFHQANLALYDSATYGVSTTIADWTSALLDKYEKVLMLPVVSDDLRGTALRMTARMQYDACGVEVTRTLVAVDPTVSVSTSGACTVPLTGVDRPDMGVVEQYGGQPVTWITMEAGQTISFAM